MVLSKAVSNQAQRFASPNMRLPCLNQLVESKSLPAGGFGEERVRVVEEEETRGKEEER